MIGVSDEVAIILYESFKKEINNALNYEITSAESFLPSSTIPMSYCTGHYNIHVVHVFYTWPSSTHVLYNEHLHLFASHMLLVLNSTERWWF